MEKNSEKLEQELSDYKSKFSKLHNQLSALDKSTAIIEFNPDSTIITANSNFLAAMGYQLNELVGKKHSIFCTHELVNSSEYSDLWNKLRQGEFYSGEIERVTKSKEIV